MSNEAKEFPVGVVIPVVMNAANYINGSDELALVRHMTSNWLGVKDLETMERMTDEMQRRKRVWNSNLETRNKLIMTFLSFRQQCLKEIRKAFHAQHRAFWRLDSVKTERLAFTNRLIDAANIVHVPQFEDYKASELQVFSKKMSDLLGSETISMSPIAGGGLKRLTEQFARVAAYKRHMGRHNKELLPLP